MTISTLYLDGLKSPAPRVGLQWPGSGAGSPRCIMIWLKCLDFDKKMKTKICKEKLTNSYKVFFAESTFLAVDDRTKMKV